MLVGSLVVSRITSRWATWLALIALLSIHLGMNYLAVRAVSMRTLNRQRANLLFSSYLENSQNVEKGVGAQGFLSPEEISLQERIFERDGVLRWRGGKVLGYCLMGVPLRQVLELFTAPDNITGSYKGAELKDAERLLDEFEEDGYILWYNSSKRTFLIVLEASSSVTTQFHAWVHALVLAKQIDQGLKDVSVLDAVIQSHSELKTISTEIFGLKLKEAGWDVETGALETRSGTRIMKCNSTSARS